MEEILRVDRWGKKNKKRGKMESEDVWKEKNCSGMIYPADFKLESSRVHKKGA